jgi:hypothetical protein
VFRPSVRGRLPNAVPRLGTGRKWIRTRHAPGWEFHSSAVGAAVGQPIHFVVFTPSSSKGVCALHNIPSWTLNVMPWLRSRPGWLIRLMSTRDLSLPS